MQRGLPRAGIALLGKMIVGFILVPVLRYNSYLLVGLFFLNNLGKWSLY